MLLIGNVAGGKVTIITLYKQQTEMQQKYLSFTNVYNLLTNSESNALPLGETER